MTVSGPPASTPRTIDLAGLDRVLVALRERSHDLIGPRVDNGVIDYAPIDSVADLPVGWTDDQQPGRYRAHRDGNWVFGFAATATSPKRYLYPPRESVLHAVRTPSGQIELASPINAEPPVALVGVKACELRAIAIQDRVLLGGPYVDEAYRARRDACFVIAVECANPSGTCFCATMDAGPAIGPDNDRAAFEVADIVLTEVPPVVTEQEPAEHRFVLRACSAAARELIEPLDLAPAPEHHVATGAHAVDLARERMGRRFDAARLHDLVLADLEHPAWDEVADRCLSCTNCTLVCPTCFCASTGEGTDLSGVEANRWREWDSCFSLSFSYLHGGSVRTTTRSRYRQWATHKLATWEDQFDTRGCVGCGRCATWCPAGIDLTELVDALGATPSSVASRLGAALTEGIR